MVQISRVLSCSYSKYQSYTHLTVATCNSENLFEIAESISYILLRTEYITCRWKSYEETIRTDNPLITLSDRRNEMIINVTYHFETTLTLNIIFVQNLIMFKGKLVILQA